MSASSKKKLRSAEQAAKMTEKQLAEQKEAKKLKLYSTLAVVVLIVLVVFAAYVGITRSIENSGIRERNTVALTIGEHKISNAELNYYFIDTVNNFYSNYGSYASLFGLDVTQPLDQQFVSEEEGLTWADDFLANAVDTAKAVYAIADEAKAAGYTLPEEATANIDNTMATMQMYASLYGYDSTNTYLKAMYGKGATEKSLRAYYEMNYLASYYQNHYQTSLTYTDEQLREAEAENFGKFSTFSYNYYYLNVNNFVESESESESEYTKTELAAAIVAAEKAAASLTDGITTAEEFDKAIVALPMNAENPTAASYSSTDISYDSISTEFVDWVTSQDRVAGDMTYVAATSTSTDAEGNTVEKIDGYYVVLFNGTNDNAFALRNVRHILVAFEGGTTDETTGKTTYTVEEKDNALKKAEELLNQWKSGEATEESFAELANAESDDGDGTTGGLYTDIYPGQMVEAFEDWCFADHEVGDTGIVETEYGYHVMYFSGNSETTYRDYQIAQELRTNDFNAWYTALVEAVTSTEGSFEYIKKDLILSAA
jgi:hypothetical protein